MTEPKLLSVVVSVCELCLNDAGGECHTPGCAFWMDDQPTGPTLLLLRKMANETRSIPAWRRSIPPSSFASDDRTGGTDG